MGVSLAQDRYDLRIVFDELGFRKSRKAVRTMTKILLVEDSKFLRLATERALTKAIKLCHDQPEAARRIRSIWNMRSRAWT